MTLDLELPMPSFTDKVVFITGASSGIGAAMGREFARQGADLALLARREDRLAGLASEIATMGRRAVALRGDVTRDGDMEIAVQSAVDHYGRIDVVVANAGFGVAGPVEKLTLPDFRRQFETNVFGVLRTVYAALPELKKTRGTLVLVSSVSGYVSAPNTAAYSMSKFAVRALAEALHAELARHGIAVVLICPGFVKSEIRQVDNRGELHPDARDPIPSWLVMPTDKAARQIVAAARRRRRERIITGHGKLFVWIKRMAPGLLAWILKRGAKGKKGLPKHRAQQEG
jgi:short-subunit dehydrogenase